jgi:hypothetical protein
MEAAGIFRHRSQGGVELPTGGKARERLSGNWKGQQIWCDSRADG